MCGLMWIAIVSFQMCLVASSPSVSSMQKLLHAHIDPSPQKCCAANEIYSVVDRNCSRANESLAGQISQLLTSLDLVQTIECAQTVVLDEQKGQNYTFQADGTLYEHQRNKTHHHDYFCIDYTLEHQRFVPIVCIDASEIQGAELLSAPGAELLSTPGAELLSTPGAELLSTPRAELLSAPTNRRQYLYGVVFSNFLLVVTLCVYVLLPELHYYEFDWSLMCHAASLSIGFFCIIADYRVSSHDTVCVPLGYMRQFWMLSSFCWLNVMGVYLWRSMYPKKISGTFHFVCLYAVGFPLLICIVTLLANKLSIVNVVIKPGFEKNCWFQDLDGDLWFNPKFIYFYNTVFATMIVNLGLFVRIAFKLLFQNPGWKPAVYHTLPYDQFYMRLFLCLKLSFVMGLSWTADLVSFFVKDEELKWRLKNLAVLLHGIFIFLIFVSNERVMTLLLSRLSIGQRVKLQVENKAMFIQVEKKVKFIPDTTISYV